jgi:hypothetical protein
MTFRAPQGPAGKVRLPVQTRDGPGTAYALGLAPGLGGDIATLGNETVEESSPTDQGMRPTLRTSTVIVSSWGS